MLAVNFFFQISSITVIGLDRYSPDAVIEVSAIEIGDNMLRLDTDQIISDILEAFPYIATVRVQRRLPPRIELIVTQHQPELVLVDSGQTALITMQGILLERGNLTPPEGLPVVRGLSLAGFEPGQTIGGADNPENHERLVMLRYLFAAAYSVDFFPITHVNVEDRLNMRIVHEERLILELGSEADLEYKLTFLRHVIENSIGPYVQARLDISNARERRLIRRDGRVIDGQFFPGGLIDLDEIYTYESEYEQGDEGEEAS